MLLLLCRLPSVSCLFLLQTAVKHLPQFCPPQCASCAFGHHSKNILRIYKCLRDFRRGGGQICFPNCPRVYFTRSALLMVKVELSPCLLASYESTQSGSESTQWTTMAMNGLLLQIQMKEI